MAVKWTRTALANLAAIVEYIEKDNDQRCRNCRPSRQNHLLRWFFHLQR